MPGIFGTLRAGSPVDLASFLNAMASRLRHHSWYVENLHVDRAANLALGRTSLGVFNREPQPVSIDDGSLVCVMDGEIHDTAKLRQALTREGCAFRGDSQAELLLRGFKARGRAFFRELNGVFVAAIWDARERSMTLVNDRFGMKPLYYSARPGALIFGPELKCLLVDPDVARDVSKRGVAQFLHFGQYMNNDTLMDAVQTLPAAGWLTYHPDEDRLTLDRYWRLEADAAIDPGRVDEASALDRIDEAFKRAVDRRTEGNHELGLSLSGGLDSRLILGAAELSRSKIKTVSVGVRGCLDHKSARSMAEMVDCPHHEYFLEGDFLSAFEQHLRYMVHLTDGQYLCQCIVIPSLPYYRELGIDVLLRGHAGELMHMNKAYNYSLDSSAMSLSSPAALSGWLFGRMSEWMTGAVTDDLFVEGADELARGSLDQALAESSSVDPSIHRIWHMFISQRLRRETALSMTEFNSVVETRLPYLDNEVVAALLAAPPSLKVGDRIQTHILTHRRPEFLKVVNSNTGARMGAGRLERNLAEFRLKVLSKLRVPGYQPYERLGAWLREELRPLVQRLLLAGPILERGVLRPDALRSVVQQHLDGRRNHTFLLLALMIFETGQRTLVDGSGETVPIEVVRGGV
jgi:asparagine synthase (glutamine-hydrolysing)